MKIENLRYIDLKVELQARGISSIGDRFDLRERLFKACVGRLFFSLFCVFSLLYFFYFFKLFSYFVASDPPSSPDEAAMEDTTTATTSSVQHPPPPSQEEGDDELADDSGPSEAPTYPSPSENELSDAAPDALPSVEVPKRSG